MPMALVKCTMAHITGNDRPQRLLLPDAVDGYVGPDNPVRFIDAFVDSLDLDAVEFMRSLTRGTSRSRTSRTAKPPGSRPTCRSLIGARPDVAATLRSRSSCTTLPPTPACVPLASAWRPCIGTVSARPAFGRCLSVTSIRKPVCPAGYATAVPRVLIDTSTAMITKPW